MVGDDEVEEGAVLRHKYRICEVTPRDKKGRPKRVEIIAWEDLTEKDVDELRQAHEPRLKPGQVAELDGRTVARGADPAAADVEETEPVQAGAANMRGENQAEFLEMARRMVWDIFQRDLEASAALREEVHELNRRALEQGKQLFELIEQLRAQAQRPPPAPQGRPLSIEDISRLIEVGATAVREIIKPPA